MKKAALIVLLLAGCVTPLERDYEREILRSKIAETRLETQIKVQESCEKRKRHASQCRSHCKYGVEWHRTYEANKKPWKKTKGAKKAPTTVFGP